MYLESKQSHENLIQLYNITNYETLNPVIFSYNISAKVVMLSHSFNPVRKYFDFKKNTSLLDSVVRQNPSNLEVRLLRYAIQKMSPSFLNYNTSIDEDLDMIKDKFDSLDSQSRKYFKIVLHRVSSESIEDLFLH